MTDGVFGNVPNMLVLKRIEHLLALARRGDQSSATQYAQVLRDKRLGYAEELHQVMDAVWFVAEVQHDGQAKRVRKGLEELASWAQLARDGHLSGDIAQRGSY